MGQRKNKNYEKGAYKTQIVGNKAPIFFSIHITKCIGPRRPGPNLRKLLGAYLGT